MLASSQILQPVRVSTIIMSFALALFLNFLPWRDLRVVPDFVALVLVFWCIRQPRLVGLGVGWALGLITDAGNGVLLGQHALSYSVLAFLGIWLSRRILWFGPGLQALHIGAMLLAAQAVAVLVRIVAGDTFPGWALVVGPLAGAVMLVAFGILLSRFFFLQVVQHEHYRSKAEDNRISIVPIPPNRGLITDRNGVVVARNYSGYTLEIFPRRVKSVEATIDELAELIEITPRDRARFKRLTVETRNPESLPIRTRLSDEDVAKFAANRFRYEGVEIKARLFRQYPFGDVGSHVIGYMGRINKDDQAELEQEGGDANYRGTDYIGRSGVEGTYERELHGTTGFEQVEIDAAGRGIRTLQTTAAQAGNNVVLTIDMQLQRVAENAFGERRGALVAIEPGTGAVLSLVSKPGFDLNLFVDGIDPTVWAELNSSLDRPLTNRAIAGVYPPGSTFKPFMALAALEMGKRTPRSTINDPGYFFFGDRRFRDSKPGGHGVVDLHKSIVVSSDVYYYMLANDMGIDAIAAFMNKLA